MAIWTTQSRDGSAIGWIWIASIVCLAATAACEDGSSSPHDAGDESVVTNEGGADGEAESPDGTVDDGGEPEDTGATTDGPTQEDDTSVDADADQGPSPTACESDDDCDDGIYCNGNETCASMADAGGKVCARAAEPPCPREHPCIEELKECDCDNPDVDGDDDGAKVCAHSASRWKKMPGTFEDCDDNDFFRCSTNKEVCDPNDRDEDCRPKTFGERDQDGDGFFDKSCRNYSSKERVWYRGDDCNDHNPSIHLRATEVCDYHDNNCNELVDERLTDAGTPEQEDGGLRERLVPDRDRDGRGEKDGKEVLACALTEAEAGYVPITYPQDCDDSNPRRYFGATEVCDGLDNDCDGETDAEDTDPPKPPHAFPGTELTCQGGRWIIVPENCPSRDVLWCEDRDPIEQGCRTDATRLSSCRACETHCQFSCGQKGCDEVVELAVGPEHTCARTKEGGVACWGRGESGRLGNDSAAPSSVPAAVIGLSAVTGVAAGQAHSCAIAAPNNTLYCWGSNRHGQLGNSDAGDASAVPVPVVGTSTPSLTNVARVAAGALHTCAILESGLLVCFGEGQDGRLGNGSLDTGGVAPRPARRRVMIGSRPLDQNVTNAKSMALGAAHGCIETTSGGVECWGSNASGQLAQSPSVVSSPYLLPVQRLPVVSAVGTGDNHNCALASDGVWCWGEDVWLQLGRTDTPDTTENWIPKRVEGSGDAIQLGVGGFASCAVTGEGTTHCWGLNASGVLGPNFTGMQTHLPVLLPLSARMIRPGALAACAIEVAGHVSCWGSNRYGQLGTGAQQDNSTPKQVRPLRVNP